MQSLINFVAKYKEYISFVALVIISLSMISISDISKIGGFRTLMIGSVGLLQDVFSLAPRPGLLKSENSAIRELNLQLSADLARSRNALVENIKLRELLELSKSVSYPFVATEIVGRTNIELRNYLTCDKGSKDSISIGMPVRTDAGLVGIVIGVTENYSLIEMINNRDIKIAAKNERSRVDGILVWEGGTIFKLKNIPTSFDVKIGDAVVTSNYSNRYPTQIPIGEIIEKKSGPGDIFLDISVKPFVNFATLEEVFVLKILPDPERINLIEDITKKLKARNAN